MLIREYFAELEMGVHEFPFLASAELTFDERTSYLGLFKGQLTFRDGSTLAVTEFVDVAQEVQIIKYKYHFARAGVLIFRYDNASDPHARRLVTFPHHKHTPTGLVASTPPTLVQVLDEIYQDMRAHLSW